MAKSKYTKDPRGTHMRVYAELYDSPAFLALKPTARDLWLAMRRDLTSFNNGNISATLAALRHRGFRSSSTLANSLRALRAVGLIEVTRQGGIASGGKFSTLYRFTDEACHALPKKGVNEMKASNEWKDIKTSAHAKKLIRDADAMAKRPLNPSDQKIDPKVRSSNRSASKTKSEAAVPDSTFEQARPAPSSKFKAEPVGASDAKAA